MAGASGAVKVCWVSVDPVRKKLDCYPRAIADMIEQKYQARDVMSASACVLGSNFFNATVHFHPSGSCYQTTPGMSLGRSGFKQPGYRSVKRLVRPADGKVSVFAKQVHGEWRIAASESDSELTFTETIPDDVCIDGSADTAVSTPEAFRAWTDQDLTPPVAWDVFIVMWQWCRGVPERHGNLMALSDEWWCPYLMEQNQTMEQAFAESRESVDIAVVDREGRDRALKIKFSPGASFALQRDEARGKERTVRRVVKTVQELKAVLDRMNAPLVDASDLSDNLPVDTIPHGFFCPITQDVMHDPVKTSDGMTYDRPAIERWFQEHNTSPLTNVALANKHLTPNTLLREKISDFIKKHASLITPMPSGSNLLAGIPAPGGPSADAAGAAAALSAMSVNST